MSKEAAQKLHPNLTLLEFFFEGSYQGLHLCGNLCVETNGLNR